MTPASQKRRCVAVITLAILCALGGCAVGPDYARPALALPDTLVAPSGAAQRFLTQQDIRADWWTVFRSPELNGLIEQAFSANSGIEAAQAALVVAQENVNAQRGFFFPSAQAGYTPARTKIAANLGGNSPGIQGNGSVIQTGQGTPASDGGSAPFNAPVIYNFHTAQLTVGYAPDVFGANCRQLASLEAQRQAQAFQVEATYLTLASNLVAAAVQDGLLRAQIALVQDIVAANEQALALAQRQRGAGHIARTDLVLQQGALAQARQLLPPLHKQFEQNRDLLRVLAGLKADAALPEFALARFALPDQLPLSLPSQLIEQRPDVRAAEEQLRAASEQVGVARAARLPQFSISGTAGGAASQFGQMFASSGKFFDLTAGITQPLFDGGTLKHREAAANASLRGAVAQYRATVAGAFQNVADVLYAIDADASALTAANDASVAAAEALDLARRQHAHGYLDRLALIGAEQAARQAVLATTQAQAARLGDAAALMQALGGGWWHRNEAAAARAQP